MQKLMIQQVEKIELNKGFSVSVTLQDEPNWEEAQSTFEHWFTTQGLHIKEMDYGADRYTWRLDLAGLTCLFHAELLTSSYWFECDDEVVCNAIMLGF